MENHKLTLSRTIIVLLAIALTSCGCNNLAGKQIKSVEKSDFIARGKTYYLIITEDNDSILTQTKLKKGFAMQCRD